MRAPPSPFSSPHLRAERLSNRSLRNPELSRNCGRLDAGQECCSHRVHLPARASTRTLRPWHGSARDLLKARSRLRLLPWSASWSIPVAGLAAWPRRLRRPAECRFHHPPASSALRPSPSASDNEAEEASFLAPQTEGQPRQLSPQTNPCWTLGFTDRHDHHYAEPIQQGNRRFVNDLLRRT